MPAQSSFTSRKRPAPRTRNIPLIGQGHGAHRRLHKDAQITCGAASAPVAGSGKDSLLAVAGAADAVAFPTLAGLIYRTNTTTNAAATAGRNDSSRPHICSRQLNHYLINDFDGITRSITRRANRPEDNYWRQIASPAANTDTLRKVHRRLLAAAIDRITEDEHGTPGQRAESAATEYADGARGR